jgi:hypothetical protein
LSWFLMLRTDCPSRDVLDPMPLIAIQTALPLRLQ